jgi:hypothetical protein
MGKLSTFAQLVAQQWREKDRIRREFSAVRPPLDLAGAEASARLVLDPKSGWLVTGITVRTGQSFTVDASGAVWLSQALAIGVEPRVALWVRIGGQAPIVKLIDNRTTYTAWADGPVELSLKTLGEWADEAGAVLPGGGGASSGAVVVTVAAWAAPRPADTASCPDGWHHLWRLGQGRIFDGARDDITVKTRGDVGILQLPAAAPVTEELTLRWSWRVEALPSRLPEQLAATHDYLSIAVEFDDGRDLTYMWSAGLPADHVFRCPLPWWCERETHWVVRSGSADLGRWCDEQRLIAADCRRAYGEVPARVERIWLIAVSVFQRREGRAQFRNIGLK